MERECIGCGCLFKPLVNDIKCPHCGGGRGEITKTPLHRIRELQEDFARQNAMDDELIDKVKHYVNTDHPLSVDMCDETGRTGMYIETGFLRQLLNRIESLEIDLETLSANALKRIEDLTKCQ